MRRGNVGMATWADAAGMMHACMTIEWIEVEVAPKFGGKEREILPLLFPHCAHLASCELVSWGERSPPECLSAVEWT